METKNEKPLPELYMLLGNIFLKPLDLAVFNLIPLQCTQTHFNPNQIVHRNVLT